MINNVIFNKFAIIRNCIKRVNGEYQKNHAIVKTSFDTQDILVLNIIRACEAAIDTASHIISKRKLGLPQESKDLFTLLGKNNIISKEVQKKMEDMVGFRNVAVHEYQEIDMDILIAICEKHINDFEDFIQEVAKNYAK